jgi:glutathione S-transferase
LHLISRPSSLRQRALPKMEKQEFVPLFYTFPLAFNPQKTRLALEEKGTKYHSKFIHALTGGNLTADYLKINPNATVPTLETSPGQYITDSNDILRYIDSQGEPLGGNLVDRALVEKWYKFVGEEWDANLYAFSASPGPGKLICDFKIKVAQAQKKKHPEFAEIYQKREDFFTRYMKELNDEEVKKSLETKLESALTDAETQLNASPFVAGNAFSMADVILITILARTESVGKQEAYLKRPALKKYFDEARKRHSYKVAIGSYEGMGALPFIIPTLGSIFARNLLHLHAY